MIASRICYCSIIENDRKVPAFIHDNQIIQVKKDSRNNLSTKSLLILTKDLTFQITKTEISQNKNYAFHLALIKDKNSIILIIEGKESFDFYMKQISIFGNVKGLQEMILNCKKIGQGSFASVYKITTNYDSFLALKAFEKKNLKTSKNKLAFQNQIDIMRCLKSKYIISLDGLFQTEKSIYFKLQYFSHSLKQYLKKTLSVKIQKRIMRQLLQGLVQMKQKNIIHRDLKPDNIMIRGRNQKNFQCVIIDFGLATKADEQKYLFNRCGTPGFLAPQIAKLNSKTDKQTPACDIFSIGCVFFKILSKKYIFAAECYQQVIEKNKNVKIPWEEFYFFSDNQSDLLKKMLEIDPIKRITPQLALQHPYFIDQIDDQDQIPFQACDLQRKMKILNVFTVPQIRIQSLESMLSSAHTSFSSKQSFYSGFKFHKINSYKDSCLSFEGPNKNSIESPGQSKQSLQQSTNKSRTKTRVSRFSQIRKAHVL